MSESKQPIPSEDGFETTLHGDGGDVAMPSIAAESRGQSGHPDDQQVAENHVSDDGQRVVEGYVHPGEPHTD